MRLRGLKLKQAPKIVVYLMVILLLGPLWLANPGPAGADNSSGAPATSLAIKTGYAGGAFTTAKVFTDSDFAGAVEQGYSFMDNLPSPVMEAAEGVPLKTLLASANISVSSIQSFTFYCTDGYTTPFTASALLGAGYYYPNEMKYWNPANNSFTDANGVDQTVYAISQAVAVVPMICIEDNWQRGAPAPDFSGLTTANKYRLVFGQSGNPATPDAMDSDKYVDEIDVTLTGTAVTGVTLNQTSGAIAAGSTDQLTATVAPTGATDQSVTWTSSNPAVATVSGAGLVTAVAAGGANITVTTADGGKTAVCAVTVTSATGGGAGAAAGAGVSLTTPASGQVFNPGNEVTISGTAQGLPAVSVTVTDPSGKVVYTVSDLNAGSGGFTTSFTLPGAAAPGGYSIKISGTGLANSLTQDFTVSAASTAPASAPTTPAPAAGNTAAPATANPGISAASFGDLQNCWAQQQITDLAASGVLRGVTPTEFLPNADITRAQFATMLDGILKLSPQQGAGPSFSDVAPGAWYYDNVSAAVYAGLISGYGGGLFGPDDPVTREQMAAMVARTLLRQTKMTPPAQPAIATILARFQDQGSISGWARADVALAVQQGIIQGKTGGALAPQAKATRAEAAVMIWQLMASLKQTGGATPAPAS